MKEMMTDSGRMGKEVMAGSEQVGKQVMAGIEQMSCVRWGMWLRQATK